MLISIDTKGKHHARSDFLTPTASPFQEINGPQPSFLYKAKIRLGV